MKTFKKVVLAFSLLLPLSAFADEQGMWLQNSADTTESVYINTTHQEIAQQQELFIKDSDIPNYGIPVAPPLIYRITLSCIIGGEFGGNVVIHYKLGEGIQSIFGSCQGGNPSLTILPKWDHFPFGKINFFNYVPKK